MIFRNNGFTLVESIIYLALIGIVLSGFVVMVISLSSAGLKHRQKEEVVANARESADIIRRKIEEAVSVNSPLAGATSSILTLEYADVSTETIKVLSDRILVEDDNSQTIYLTNDDVKISEIVFYNLGSDNKDSIRFTYQVSSPEVDSEDLGATIDVVSAATLRL